MVADHTLDPPLSDAELGRLGQFLDARPPGPGHLRLDELHGLLTALISGPEPVPPAEWLPLVWREAGADTGEEADEILDLVMRLHNDISTRLAQRGSFRPLLHRERPDAPEQPQGWCRGYAMGTGFRPRRWRAADDRLFRLLFPILLLDAPGPGQSRSGRPDPAAVAEVLPHVVQRIYDYWRPETRQEAADPA